MSKIIIDVQDLGDEIVLASFRGSFDGGTIDKSAPAVNDALSKGKSPSLILDFTELEYTNSRGIGEMSEWYTKVMEKNGQVVYFGANDMIRDILEVVNFTDLFEEAKDLEDAKKRIRS